MLAFYTSLFDKWFARNELCDDHDTLEQIIRPFSTLGHSTTWKKNYNWEPYGTIRLFENNNWVIYSFNVKWKQRVFRNNWYLKFTQVISFLSLTTFSCSQTKIQYFDSRKKEGNFGMTRLRMQIPHSNSFHSSLRTKTFVTTSSSNKWWNGNFIALCQQQQ